MNQENPLTEEQLQQIVEKRYEKIHEKWLPIMKALFGEIKETDKCFYFTTHNDAITYDANTNVYKSSKLGKEFRPGLQSIINKVIRPALVYKVNNHLDQVQFMLNNTPFHDRMVGINDETIGDIWEENNNIRNIIIQAKQLL